MQIHVAHPGREDSVKLCGSKCHIYVWMRKVAKCAFWGQERDLLLFKPLLLKNKGVGIQIHLDPKSFLQQLKLLGVRQNLCSHKKLKPWFNKPLVLSQISKQAKAWLVFKLLLPCAFVA